MCITESIHVIILEGTTAAMLFPLTGLGLSVIMSTEDGSAVTGSILRMVYHIGNTLQGRLQRSLTLAHTGYQDIGLSSEESALGLEDTGLIDLIVND